VRRHLRSALLLTLALGVPGLASAQVEGADGIDAPPGSTAGQEAPAEPEAPAPPAETEPEQPEAPAAGSEEGTAPAEGATPATGPAEGTAPAEGTPPASGPTEGAAPAEGAAAEADEPALPPTADGTGEAAAPETAPLRVIVVDAAPHGVAPVVGQHVTERIRLTARAMGYELVDPMNTVSAAQRMQMPYPPTPADLWRVTYVSRSQRGVFAKVWAHEGRYVFEISVASLDGAGPFFARGTSGAEDLHEVVERLTREALPVPGTFDAEAAARYAQPQPAQPQPAAAPAFPQAQPRDRIRVSQRRVSRRPTRRWDVSLQTEAAFGTSSEFFYNHLIGLRLGFRITKGLHLGLYGAYANLRGRGQRESNLLPMLQLTNRIRVSRRSDLTVPIRAAVGYLPFNGPVIRLSAGLNYPISDRWEIGADILVPTFWFVDDEVQISLNVGLELTYRL